MRYNATIAGPYQLHVTLGDGEAVAESPYPVRILPARAFARSCAVVGDGRRAAVAGSPATFHVEVKDRFGNPLAGDMLVALPLDVRHSPCPQSRVRHAATTRVASPPASQRCSSCGSDELGFGWDGRSDSPAGLLLHACSPYRGLHVRRRESLSLVVLG